MTTPIEHEHDERPEAVRQAEAGARAWRVVVHVQQSATPDHADFYALAGELVDTLAALTSLARVLARQLQGYPDGLPAGAVVYDDTRRMDPQVRLADAVRELDQLSQVADAATCKANRFWSGISHIGVEHAEGEVSR